MKKIHLPIGLALGLAACGGAVPEADAPERVDSAATLVVAEDTVLILSPVEGSVVARRRAEVSTRVMARVAEVLVEIGSSVRSGQVLLLLGTEDVAAGQAKAAAGVEIAEAARDEAARHVARMDTLYAQDVVTLVQRDQARLALVQAEAGLEVALASRQEANTASGYARIAAPFQGTIVARRVDPGDMAAPGMPLLVVESAGPRDAVLAVPVELAGTLALGDTLTVTRREGQHASGWVRAIAGGADQGSRTVEVRVTIPSDWPTGASVTGLVPSGPRVAIMIPSTSVVRRGQLTGVSVVTGAEAGLRWVRLGRTIGDRVEVLSGLEAGDRIVL